MSKKGMSIPTTALILLIVSIVLVLGAFVVVHRIQSASIAASKEKMTYVHQLFDVLSKSKTTITILDTRAEILQKIKSAFSENRIPYTTTTPDNLQYNILLLAGGKLDLKNSVVCFTDIPPYFVYSYDQWEGFDYVHYLQQFGWDDLVLTIFDSVNDIKGISSVYYEETSPSVVKFSGSGNLVLSNLHINIEEHPLLVIRYKKINGDVFIKLRLQNIHTSEVKEIKFSIAPTKGSRYYHTYVLQEHVPDYTGWMYFVVSLYPTYKEYSVTSIELEVDAKDFRIDYIAFVLNPNQKSYRNLYRLDIRDLISKEFLARCSLIIWYTADSDFYIVHTHEYISDVLRTAGIPVVILDKRPFAYVFATALYYRDPSNNYGYLASYPELYIGGGYKVRARTSTPTIEYLTLNTKPYIKISSRTIVGDGSKSVPVSSTLEVKFYFDKSYVVVNGARVSSTTPLSVTPSTFKLSPQDITSIELYYDGEWILGVEVTDNEGIFIIPSKSTLYYPLVYMSKRDTTITYSPYIDDKTLYVYSPKYSCLVSEPKRRIVLDRHRITSAKGVSGTTTDPVDSAGYPYYLPEFDTSTMGSITLPGTFNPNVYIVYDVIPRGVLYGARLIPSIGSIVHISGIKVLEGAPSGETNYFSSTDVIPVKGTVRFAVKIVNDPYRTTYDVQPMYAEVYYDGGEGHVCVVGKDKLFYHAPIGTIGTGKLKDIRKILDDISSTTDLPYTLPKDFIERVVESTAPIINIYVPYAILSTTPIVQTVKYKDYVEITVGDVKYSAHNVLLVGLEVDECYIKYEDLCISGKKGNIVYIPAFVAKNIELLAYVLSKVLV